MYHTVIAESIKEWIDFDTKETTSFWQQFSHSNKVVIFGWNQLNQ